MNMQQFTGWVARLLDALPWRRAQRAPRAQMQAHMASPSKVDRFALPDTDAVRRQKVETNPPCSTLHEDPPAPPELTAPPEPLLLSPPPPPEASRAPLMALPTPPAAGAADASASVEPSAQPQPLQADPERRLAFARYLFRRGVFNEGFTGESLPAQYRDRRPQE
jgi:hypothetical protein